MAATSGEQDTERAIGTKLIAAGDARTAVLRRVYPASPETLWQAITDRTHLRRWFIEPRGDLRFGGTFALEGHAHGRILRCDPPRMLRVTWVYGPQPRRRARDQTDQEPREVGRLSSSSTLRSPTRPRTACTDALLGVGVGWELAMDHLGRHLDGDLPLPDHPTAAGSELQPTPEDRQLMAASARAWKELFGAPD